MRHFSITEAIPSLDTRRVHARHPSVLTRKGWFDSNFRRCYGCAMGDDDNDPQSRTFNIDNGDLLHLRNAAVGYAITWFMRRGHVASVPIVTTRYDLVVDTDSGLKKIQVKTTNSRENSGRFLVFVSHAEYDSTRQSNASGKRRRVPYDATDVDWFFILTSEKDIYLIPRSVTGSRISLTLDKAWASYRQAQ